MKEKKMKTRIQQMDRIETIVDTETGEVKQESTTSISRFAIEQEPDYVKLYIKDLSRIIGLSNTDNDVVLNLLRNMNYDNIIALNAYTRKQMCEQMRIKPNTLSHILSKLIEKNILKRLGANTYEMNPYLYGKGKWENIRQLRMTFTYDKDGRAVEMERVSEGEETHTLNGIGEIDVNDAKQFIEQLSETMLQALKQQQKPKGKPLQFLD